MKIKIEIDEKTLRKLVVKAISEKMGDIPINPENVVIEVKSKQNYKSEWEPADFRAIYTAEAGT